MPGLIVLHKIPLTIILNSDGTLNLTCDVPGIVVGQTPDELTLGVPPPALGLFKHVYAYTIDPPPPTVDYRHYAAVFSGPSPHELELWDQRHGESQSEGFKLDDGEHSEYVAITVLAEPRPRTDGLPPATPRAYSGRRRVKIDFQGGGDDL